MSKVITFSRTFPAYHELAGKPTFFVEKIWKSLHNMGRTAMPHDAFREYGLTGRYFNVNKDKIPAKDHTIRAGKRWNVGDRFSPRVWSGKPYNSKQIIIAPDIEIVKEWKVSVDLITTPSENGKYATACYGFMVDGNQVPIETIAKNDGLEYQELKDWFGLSKALDKQMLKRRLFDGQIICWNPEIEYTTP